MYLSTRYCVFLLFSRTFDFILVIFVVLVLYSVGLNRAPMMLYYSFLGALCLDIGIR